MENELNIVLNDDENARDEFSTQNFFKFKRIGLPDDENARDEFSTQNFFKLKRIGLQDITNKVINNVNCDDKRNQEFENCSNISTCNDIPIKIPDKEVLFSKSNVIVSLKRKVSVFFDNNYGVLKRKIFDTNYQTSHFVSYQTKPSPSTNLEDNYNDSEFIVALSVPASGYNGKYVNDIVVSEPERSTRLLQITQNCVLWSTMMDSAKIEWRTLCSPCRMLCSPVEQFSLSPNMQYISNGLIENYFCDSEELNLFREAIHIDTVNKMSHRHPYLSHTFMPDSINILLFHELFIEKLPCNKLYDFMPHNSELTGSILGGFINGLFELSEHVFLSSEVIHMAVDLIYQYLSRVRDVPLNDIILVTQGAIYMASKYEGHNYKESICNFTACSPSQLKLAEFRLSAVVDFNLWKPNAIYFRNRYLMIERSTSIILHISSFLLDMTLHCYTLMILPASLRAAAALWLARLIEEFQDIRINDRDEFDFSDDFLRDKMASVWPEHYHKLTGYHHSEIAQLAIRMHVVVLAFLCRGQQQNPSVNACYNKYSNDMYKNLTGSYEKFTSRVVFYGAELYCYLHNLVSSEWLERNEYDSLQSRLMMTPSAATSSFVVRSSSFCQTTSTMMTLDQSSPSQDTEVLSCPPELCSRPIIRRVNSDACPKTMAVGVRFSGDGDSDKSKLRKLDSGYSTCSNLTMGGFGDMF